MTKYERSSCLLGEFRTLAFLARESSSKTKSLMKQMKTWAAQVQREDSSAHYQGEDSSDSRDAGDENSDDDAHNAGPVISNPNLKRGRPETGRHIPAHQGGGSTSGTRRRKKAKK